VPSTQPPTPGSAPADRPALRPVDLPMVPFALGGMIAWAVAGLILLAFHGWLAAHGHTNWLWICLAGFLLGLPGLAVMRKHDANRRRRRAAPTPQG
jgi:predicted lipid-binding transport protein (Tim44 family)